MGQDVRRMDGQRVKETSGLNRAIAACRLRGLQVTPLREQALLALWRAERPLTAYELREKLIETTKRNLAAQSVYRVLDFLCENGVAKRIESLNAYVACRHPDHEHACVFLLCNACGASIEIEDKKLERLIAADAEREGFVLSRRVVELSGVCAPCQAAAR